MIIKQQLDTILARHGYLPEVELKKLADRLAIPLYRIQEVVSFYSHYRITPPPAVEIHVCRDMSCHLRGAPAMIAKLQQGLASASAAEQPENQAAVCPVSCLGRCDRAIAARIYHNPPHDAAHGNGDPAGGHHVYNFLSRSAAEIQAAAESLLRGDSQPIPAADSDSDLPDRSAEWKINVYANQPREQRYQALRRVVDAICGFKPTERLGRGLKRDRLPGQAAGDSERDRITNVLLKNSVLLGMGGAGGQAFKKWSEVRKPESDQKYVICNADESEPGTFKDRELLLRTPGLIVEGVLLAALVVGANQGYIYIRHEYEECIEAVREEIEWARQMGLCGENILGSELTIQVDEFTSPGGYICGEQTALIQAMEDKRAEPRIRPPEIQTNGLWDKPTLVNNVETLAWAPAVILHGEASAVKATAGAGAAAAPQRSGKDAPDTDRSWYAGHGRPFGEVAAAVLATERDWSNRHGAAPRFPGLRMFSISGDVQVPGVYEVENGITVRDLIERAGGMREGQALLAMALSGPSGGFTPARLERADWPEKLQRALLDLPQIELLDLQMHINYFRAWDLMLGAGIVVYGAKANLVEQALACLRFFQAESCGKCVPCRIGSTKLAEIGDQLAQRQLTAEDVARLEDEYGPVKELEFAMKNTAICGLGTVASNPLTSLLRFFPTQVQQYTRGASSAPSR